MWTLEEQIISGCRDEFSRKHLCYKCNRIFDIELWENTTVDLHPCQYAYKEGYETEDNGGGFWVTRCNHFIPIDTRKIYKAWLNSDEWEKISYQKKKCSIFHRKNYIF